MQHFSALISGPLSCCPPSWRCWTLDCFLGLVKPSEPSSNNASMWSLLEIFKKYFFELWFFKSLEVWNAHLSGKWWDDCITHTMRTVIYLGARRRLKWLRRLDNSGESYWELREQIFKPNQIKLWILKRHWELIHNQDVLYLPYLSWVGETKKGVIGEIKLQKTLGVVIWSLYASMTLPSLSFCFYYIVLSYVTGLAPK